MTDKQARSAIIGSFVLVLVLVELRRLVHGHGLAMRPVIGAFAGAAVLAAVSEAAADLAAAFAVLVLVATIIRTPPDVWNALGGSLGGTDPGKRELNRLLRKGTP